MKATPQQLAHLRIASEPQLTVSDAAWAKAVPIFSYRECAKEEYLLRAGEVSEYFYFVLQGVLRQFYTKEDGKEFNKSFSVEDEPCGSFRSALTRMPSRFAIQALEPCQLLQYRFADMYALCNADPEWAHFARKAAEYQTLINEEREAEFLLDPAPTRYQHFRQQHPGLEDRIPQYQIASYLGITNVALSRIRKKLSITPTS